MGDVAVSMSTVWLSAVIEVRCITSKLKFAKSVVIIEGRSSGIGLWIKYVMGIEWVCQKI